MRTKDFAFKGPHAAQDAERFAEAMETYSDDDLPWRLTRRDEHGRKRMLDAAQTGGAASSFAADASLAGAVEAAIAGTMPGVGADDVTMLEACSPSCGAPLHATLKGFWEEHWRKLPEVRDEAALNISCPCGDGG